MTNATRTGGITVLHVEDDVAFADLAADRLETVAEDLTVVSVGDAEAALDRLADDGEFDCIVSDYDMPGRNGLELLAAVREDRPDLPFVLFTAKGSEEVASRAITAGVTDYVRKRGARDCYEMLAKRIRDAVERYRSEERYHNLVDTAPVPIVLFGPDARLRYANDAAVEFLEADDRAALVDRPMSEFVHEDYLDAAHRRFDRLMAEGEAAPRAEFRLRTVGGAVKRAVIATAPGFYRGERVAQVIVRTSE